MDTFNSFEDCVQLLEQCSRLECCSIGIGYLLYLPLPDTPHTPILVPNLSLWKITTSSAIIWLMDHFTMPSLDHLIILFDWEAVRHPDLGYKFDIDPTWPREEFSAFILRSSCPVSTIHLRWALLTVSDLTELVTITGPFLQCLTIDSVGLMERPGIDVEPCVDDSVLVMLTRGGDLDCCPVLKELHLLGCISSTRGVLAAMVASRINSEVPDCAVLTSLTVHCLTHGDDVHETDLFYDFCKIRRVGLPVLLCFYDRHGEVVII
jgi:hypothetical protein